MTLVKRLERELILDWQRIQLEMTPSLKSEALRAYYRKLANYRKSKAWSMELRPAQL